MGNETLTGSCAYHQSDAGVWPPTSFNGECITKNETLVCGTPCDTDGNTTTHEYVNLNGICTSGGGSCTDIWKDVNVTGNTSALTLNLTLDCLCSSTASCEFTVKNEGNTLSSHSFTANANGESGTFTFTDLNMSTGTNEIWLNCSCGTPQGCTYLASKYILNFTSDFTGYSLYCSRSGNVTVRIHNIGSIKLADLNISGSYTDGESSSIGSSTYSVDPGRTVEIPLELTPSCDLYESPVTTGGNATSITFNLNVSVSGKVLRGITGTAPLYQCYNVTYCPVCCSSASENCFATGLLESNFTCSYGVCCASGEHFMNAACCENGYTCCLHDSVCSSDEWCANSTSYEENYSVKKFTCANKFSNGAKCSEDRMCTSGNCENNSLNTEKYCCSSIATVADTAECHAPQEGVCESSGCCASDSDCSSGEWCTPSSHRCVTCPQDGDDAYFNRKCADARCTGYDADCCETDSDCSTASTKAGVEYYCEETINTCISCSKSLDLYCPSSNCYEQGVGVGDPDCCNVSRGDSDCQPGYECRLIEGETWLGRCIPTKLGSACSSDGECGSGLSCIEGSCVLDSFVSVNPSHLNLKLGEIGKAVVIVTDPQMKADSYTMRLSGDYAKFARFAQGKVISFTMEPNGIKKFTLFVYGAERGTGKQLTVSAMSNTKPLIQGTVLSDIDIEGITQNGVSSAPGIGLREALAVLVIAGAVAWSMKKL